MLDFRILSRCVEWTDWVDWKRGWHPYLNSIERFPTRVYMDGSRECSGSSSRLFIYEINDIKHVSASSSYFRRVGIRNIYR